MTTEQKLQDDEHHMYPEHAELLPWVLSNLPVTLPENHLPGPMEKAYAIFYEYVQTLINYQQNRETQDLRKKVMQRREGMKNSQVRMQFMLKYEGLRTMREM